ncbi:hypothetical protein EP7_000673 [Isosphaeraceae bacterium EP7]
MISGGKTTTRAIVAGLLPWGLAGGCSAPWSDGGVLVVATSWPSAERLALEEAFRPSGRIAWIEFLPGADPTRIAGRRSGVDALLGGPISRYRELERRGEIVPGWKPSQRQPVGLLGPEGKPTESVPEPPDALAMGDPRLDPASLAWLMGISAGSDWAAGYARLVKLAGLIGPDPRREGSALAEVERGEAVAAVAGGVLGGTSTRGVREEGAGVLRDAPHAQLAAAFLALVDSGATPTEINPLMADLLGSTLVEARPELLQAWETLERTDHPPRAERWLSEPPPWPPTSVALLRSKPNGAELVDLLAEQLTEDLPTREWLILNWDRPPRKVDPALLDELVNAVEGRLASEPRFRAWLRVEWTSWARQRYRRVARQASGAWVP